MTLVLVRHAAAVVRSPARRDAARALTPRGRAAFEEEVRGLDAIGLRLDLVLHSPLLRATQTADLLAPLVRGGGRFAVTPHLAKAPAPALLGEFQGGRVAVVGHEPWLSELAAWLVTGRREEGARFPMKKGGVLVLDGAPRLGGMRLVAAYPPRALRR